MIRLSKLLLFFLYFWLSHGFAENVIDDNGVRLDCTKPAQRVISLAPDLTEILFAIGASSKLVGVIKGSDFPKEANKIPLVGSYTGIDLERIIQLHPDLIVTWSDNFKRQLNVLRKFKIPIYTNRPRRLEDIPRTLENLGCLLGQRKAAHQSAEIYSSQLEQIKLQYRSKKSLKVFYQMGSYSLFTINKESWINQAIEFCGGKNIFAEAKMIVPEISWEALLSANPQVILSDTSDKHWKKRWQKWQQIPAVKNNYLFSIPADWIDRAGPRLIQGVDLICHYLDEARLSRNQDKKFPK